MWCENPPYGIHILVEGGTHGDFVWGLVYGPWAQED